MQEAMQSMRAHAAHAVHAASETTGGTLWSLELELAALGFAAKSPGAAGSSAQGPARSETDPEWTETAHMPNVELLVNALQHVLCTDGA